jgi:hypothetical protein
MVQQHFVARNFGNIKSNRRKAVTDSSAQAHTEVVFLQKLQGNKRRSSAVDKEEEWLVWLRQSGEAFPSKACVFP